MKSSIRVEIEDFRKSLKTYGSKVLHNLLSAILIWLFGNLVFIPLASSLNWQTRAFCTLIFFVAFSFFIFKALPGLKKLIDSFSVFPARKYGLKKGLTYENSLVLFRYVSYIVISIIFYLLYFPLLANFHFAVSGIVLILVLIGIFFLILRMLQILFNPILEWLST